MASTEALIFDAAASNIDGTDPGSPLTVGWGTNYRLFEHEYPAPPQNVQYASSVDTEGELPSSSRYGNRTITLKFKLVDSTGALRTALQAKFAKLQREGGTLKRTMANGDVRFYDILAGDGWNPSYDFAYYTANLTIVEMVLPARPFSRGAEVDLGDNVETTLPVLVFTDTSIAGDVPGLGRLVIDEDQNQQQRTVMWGIESRNYSSASTAGLFFQAEALTVNAGALAAGPAGASGAGNNTILNGSLSGTMISQWELAGTHVGTFRVIGRFQVPLTNTGTVSLQLYSQVGLDQFVLQDVVSFASSVYGGGWLLVDLGIVSARLPNKGARSLTIGLDASSTTAGDDLYTDWIALIPGEEGSGIATGTLVGGDPLYPLEALGTLQVDYKSVEGRESGGTTWGRPAIYEGDYLLIPPSGAEGRTVRVIVKASRGRLLTPVLPSGFSGSSYPDIGTDDISARLFYTPRYLT